MERIPRWVKGKVALMGDAAHPFLPRECLSPPRKSKKHWLNNTLLDQGQGGKYFSNTQDILPSWLQHLTQ